MRHSVPKTGNWQAPLATALTQSGAAADPEVIAAAQQWMALLDEMGSRAGKHTADLRDAQGAQVGDGGQHVNLFTSRPEIA